MVLRGYLIFLIHTANTINTALFSKLYKEPFFSLGFTIPFFSKKVGIRVETLIYTFCFRIHGWMSFTRFFCYR